MIKKVIIGIMAGLVSGFFGAGGGMILVPAYIYILKMPDKRARATSIFSIMPMVLVSSLFYIQKDYLNWQLGIKCIIGGIIGGIIGTKLLEKFSTKTLKILFTFFLIYAAIKMIM